MRFQPKDVAWVIGLLMAINFCILAGIFDPAELGAGDFAFTLRGSRPPATDIVIVAIDHDSFALNQLRWPWPRNYMARIIKVIAQAKPAVVGIPLLFSDPSDPQADAALAEALREINRTVIASDYSVEESAFGYVQRLQSPIALLIDSTTAVGPSNIDIDPDGVVRSVPLSLGIDQFYSSFAAEVAALYLYGRPWESSPLRHHPTAASLVINYDGPAGTFQHVSAARVAESEIPAQVFAHKIVLIGATDPTLKDLYAVPFGRFQKPMSGVEVLAHAIDTIIADDPIQRYGVSGYTLGLPPRPTETDWMTGSYLDTLRRYIVGLGRSPQMTMMVIATLAVLLGYGIGSIRRRKIILGTIAAIMLSYALGWICAFIVLRAQLPIVTPEIGFAAGVTTALLKSHRLQLLEHTPVGAG